MRAAAAGIARPSVSALLSACTDDPTAEGGPPVKLLAPTPPMGWNSWNVYGDDIDEEKILRTADAIIGSDLTRMDGYTIETLTNAEVIALRQDPLGKQAARVRKDGDLEVFAKPLANGDQGVALLNRGPTDAEMEVAWQEDLGLDAAAAAVRDLWAHRDLGVSTGRFATTVRSHEATILRVTPQTSG